MFCAKAILHMPFVAYSCRDGFILARLLFLPHRVSLFLHIEMAGALGIGRIASVVSEFPYQSWCSHDTTQESDNMRSLPAALVTDRI
jgi:hypothetical protein